MSEPLILLNYLYDEFNFFSLFGFKKRGPKTCLSVYESSSSIDRQQPYIS